MPHLPAPRPRHPPPPTRARVVQVLSDDEKRQIYDLEGLEGLERHEKGAAGGGGPMSPFDMFFGGGGGGRRKGPDASVEMEVSLEDLYNGAQRAARISRNVICPKCRGTGAKDGETQKCKACGGRGVRMVQQQMAPGFVVQMQEQCGECGGRGTIAKAACPHCGGRKVLMEEKTLTADIERGMPSDGEIRFARESEQSPGITPGDVIFKLRAGRHARFEREGDNLKHEVHLTLREALLGYRRSVRHLDGRDVPLVHDGVTQPFEVGVVVVGEGGGGAG
jgi:DnaJ-related protein SCJ1